MQKHKGSNSETDLISGVTVMLLPFKDPVLESLLKSEVYCIRLQLERIFETICPTSLFADKASEVQRDDVTGSKLPSKCERATTLEVHPLDTPIWGLL